MIQAVGYRLRGLWTPLHYLLSIQAVIYLLKRFCAQLKKPKQKNHLRNQRGATVDLRHIARQ